MENFIYYLLKSVCILVVFYGCYWLLLRKETLFISNRLFFLIGIVLSITLPWITFTETVLLPYTPTESLIAITKNTLVSGAETTAVKWQHVITVVYLLGVLFFVIRLLFQFKKLHELKRISEITLEPPFKHVKTPKPLAPFSFFNLIFYYPNNFTTKELDAIIRHEKVHALQKHSIDILAVELLFILQWFNPFIWLYKNHLKQNLEFLADEACQTSDRKFYQMLLLKEAVGVTNIPLSTSFYNSIVKKRIVMLNKEKSKKMNFTKSLIVLPILALFLMAFNTKIIYQVAEAPTQQLNDLELIIKKNTQNQTLDIFKEVLLKKDIDFSYTVVRNAAAEIIDIELDMEGISDTNAPNYNAYYKSTSGEPISPVVIKLNTTAKSLTIGNWDSVESTNKSYSVTSEITEIKIEMDKDSQSETYTSNQKFLKAKGVAIDFKGVKRNEKNEITAIKVFYDNGAGQKGSYIRKRDTPIKPFEIIVKFENKEGAVISILEKGPGALESISYSEISNTAHDSSAIRLKANTKTQKFIIRQEGSTNVILIDDKEVPRNELERLGEKELIKTVELFKNNDSLLGKATLNGLTRKDAAGNETRIIRIDTDAENESEFIIIKPKHKNTTSDNSTLVDIIAVGGKSELTSIQYSEATEKPLIIIDGKKAPNDQMNGLDSNNIESVSVLKGKAAKKKYGEEGKNGVIEITTKKE